jgi:hypothetical protein
MSKLQKPLTWIGLVVGAVALILQFVISMQAYLAAGRDVPGALGMFFSYFTILTNLTLVLIYIREMTSWRWLAPFGSLVTRGMMVAAMLLVMTFVHYFLRGLTHLTGLFLVADTLLHYVTPLLYLLWWLLIVRHGPLRLADVPVMLAPTLVYFLYVLARGALVQEYPYPVINVLKLGYPHVLLNAVYLTLGLGALCLIVVGVDEVLSRRRKR